MNRIGVVGISWRQGGPEKLARFTASNEERGRVLLRLAEEASLHEVVYVATCNRVEVVFVGDGETSMHIYRRRIFETLVGRRSEPGEAERALRAWVKEGAAEHLLLVTAGLDSARIGETEISGQVHRAYDLSRELSLTGPRLDLLFEEAFKVARRVHRKTGLDEGRESLAEIAIDHLRRRLRGNKAPIALVGVSDMTRRCARELAEDAGHIHVVNRTLEHAQELAEECGGTAHSLESFRESPTAVEAIVSATGAPRAVLARADLERITARTPSGEPVLIVDMAIPPDVHPEDARVIGIERVGMEEVIAEAKQNRERRLHEMADARNLVDEALDGLRRRLADRVLSPWIAALQRRFRQTALEGVERLFRKELKDLGGPSREVIKRWAETLARRFAHLPSKGLKGVAYENGSGAVDAFFKYADDAAITELLRESEACAVSISIPNEEDGEEVR